MNKIHNKHWSAFVGYLYIMDQIKTPQMEHIKMHTQHQQIRYFRYDTSYVFIICLNGGGGADYCGQCSNAMDGLGFESGRGKIFFFLFRSVQTGLGPIQLYNQLVLVFFRGSKAAKA